MQPRVMHGHSDRVKLVSSVRPQSSRNDVGFVVALCHRSRLINECVGRRLSIVHQSVLLTLRLLMFYIYGAHILDVSRLHTTTHHSR